MFTFNNKDLYTYRSKDKIVSLKKARQLRNAWRLTSEKVVFTNGCFDILHLGHIEYLEKAYYLGDKLIVGVNSDASVQKLKGKGRPLRGMEERTRLLASLEFVNAVVIFDEDTPENLIRELKPDILVKGGDYSEEQIVGADFVKSYGGKVEIIPLLEGFSTTNFLRKLKEL